MSKRSDEYFDHGRHACLNRDAVHACRQDRGADAAPHVSQIPVSLIG